MRHKLWSKVKRIQCGEGGTTILEAAVIISISLVICAALLGLLQSTLSLERSETRLRTGTGWERQEGFEDESEAGPAGP